MLKYSYEQRKKAVQYYLEHGGSIERTVKDLGYPSESQLRYWILCDSSKAKEGNKKYTDEQKRIAIQYYLENGKSLAATIRKLGYPSANRLREWLIQEHALDTNDKACAKYTEEQIKVAIQCYLENGKSLEATIKKLGYPTKRTLCNWLRDNGFDPEIKSKVVYTEEQRKIAVQYYLEHGRSMRDTRKKLGYPTSSQLRYWISADVSDFRLSIGVKYTEEQKKIAVQHYLEHGKSMTATIKTLGYPTLNILRKWIKEYGNEGSFKATLHYSQEQRKFAVDYYLKHGRSIKKTIKDIGYPSKVQLRRWIIEDVPNIKVKIATQYTEEQKKIAINFYLEHGKDIIFTVRKLGYPTANQLARWIDKYAPHVNRKTTPHYTSEQRRIAVEYYMEHGMSIKKAVKELGYPSRNQLKRWLLEDVHSSVELNTRTTYTEEQIEFAVRSYFENGKSIDKTIESIGYPNRSSLREWIVKNTKDVAPVVCSQIFSPLLEEKNTNTNLDTSLLLPELRNHHVNNDKDKNALEDKCTEIKYTGTTKAFQKRKTRVSSPIVSSGHEEHKATSSKDTEIMEKTPEDIISAANSIPDLELKISFLCAEINSLCQQKQDLNEDIHSLSIEKEALEKASALIKKEQGINLKTLTNQEKVIVIDALRDKYALQELLLIFDMAKSSYFYQKKAMTTNAYDKYADIREIMRQIFHENYNSYGYRRMHQELKTRGITISEKIILRLMKEENLVVPFPKLRKYRSYQGEITPAVENIVNRDFHASKPNEKWLTDITEFSLPKGKVYLATILDCFDGLPVSWGIHTSPNEDLANNTLLKAISTLKNGEHPIIHSDRGCHYRWYRWIDITERAELIRSMSQKGCSPDNAACEGHFGHIKNEMFYGRSWNKVSIPEFMNILNTYMFWFAEKRIKMSLGGMSPMQYRRKLGLIA